MPDIKAQNEKALASVKAIYDAAEQAKADASRAKDAADDAVDAAAIADQKAGEAKVSAQVAGKAASGALNQLSIVEDVVGVITWITKHGTYAVTHDTEVVPGKHYFTKSGDNYNLVINPAADPSQAGYYELTGVDEAVSNYVASHLALTDQGLWVTKDNNAYKILLASDGMKVYDSEGHQVALFGESIEFSSTRPQYIGGEDAFIIFYDSDNDGVPDAINIGGSSVTILGNKRLSDILTNLDISTRQTSDGAEITVGSHTVSLQNGEDAVLLRIDSSRGNVFKNNTVSTVLTVNLIKAGETITNATRMHEVFGVSSYIQWYWRRIGDDQFYVLLPTDSMISDDGFTLTLTPDKVDTKVTFQCELIV